MNWPEILQAVLTAVAISIIVGTYKVFRRVDALEIKVQPVVDWWFKTSMDALKLATNPTSERLAELADKYIACVIGKGKISGAEKQELIDGLMEIYNDRDSHKRQSASISLRFIESREGLKLLPEEVKRDH